MANFYDNSLPTQVTGTVRVEKFSVPLPVTGTISSRPIPTTVALQTSVSASTTSSILVSANGARKALWIYNYGSSHLCLSLGSTADSGSNYFLRVAPDGFWELPWGQTVYTGNIAGIWESASSVSGSAQIVELR